MGEFDLIARYFKRPVRRAALGGGDDCALLQASPRCQIAISCDMLVQGRHFFADADPFKLGHKALAVNLSDLAACGTRPLAFLLALALPNANEVWLAAFSRGLMALADAHECELIGGDTTQGPLNICITVLGEVPLAGARSTALLRSGARAGDELFVSGTLGDARLALMASRGLALPPGLLAKAKQRLDAPTPRVALGLALRGLATAAIDISDGLLGDLAHLLEASAVGACLDTSVAATLMACSSAELDAAVDAETRLEWILGGGDDYELLFTAPPAARDAVEQAALASATRVTRIGQIQAEPGLRLFDAKGAPVAARYRSFDHFA